MTFTKRFDLDGKAVGAGCPTYLIAEMSANHGNDLQKARDIVHAAKESGADAIKLQTYTADTLTLNCRTEHFFLKEGPWQGQYMHDLYTYANTPWEWHAELFELARSIGLTCFSSPFDPTSIEFLETLNAPAYKIASPEVIELPLIRQAAETGKPVIISTGGATVAEIQEAADTARAAGATDVVFLKCTASYPAPPDSMNLNTIPDMRERFDCLVGLSDHTLGFAVPIASIGLGACMIEKHFILDRDDETADSFFSMTPDEFRIMVDCVRIAEQAVGVVSYPEASDIRRTLYAVTDIKSGECFSHENIRSLRPGGGVEPKLVDQIIGSAAKSDIPRGMPIKREMVDGL